MTIQYKNLHYNNTNNVTLAWKHITRNNPKSHNYTSDLPTSILNTTDKIHSQPTTVPVPHTYQSAAILRTEQHNPRRHTKRTQSTPKHFLNTYSTAKNTTLHDLHPTSSTIPTRGDPLPNRLQPTLGAHLGGGHPITTLLHPQDFPPNNDNTNITVPNTHSITSDTDTLVA
jgi:hypothetical protein